MNYVVYILISETKANWSYVGSTSNIAQRFIDHSAGKTKSTKAYRPLKIIYTEKYNTKEEAYKRESFLKSGFGREEKKMIVAQFNSGIV